MKEQLIHILKKRGPITIPELCDILSLDGDNVRALLTTLLSEKMIRAIVEPNEFGCTGCSCGSCPPIPPKYAVV